MKMVGSVEVPQEAFIAVLSTDESAARQGQEVAPPAAHRRGRPGSTPTDVAGE